MPCHEMNNKCPGSSELGRHRNGVGRHLLLMRTMTRTTQRAPARIARSRRWQTNYATKQSITTTRTQLLLSNRTLRQQEAFSGDGEVLPLLPNDIPAHLTSFHYNYLRTANKYRKQTEINVFELRNQIVDRIQKLIWSESETTGSEVQRDYGNTCGVQPASPVVDVSCCNEFICPAGCRYLAEAHLSLTLSPAKCNQFRSNLLYKIIFNAI